MGLKKISDAPKTCLHPEHDPPRHYAYENGTYEYNILVQVVVRSKYLL